MLDFTSVASSQGCMYVCKIYLTSVKNVIIKKSSIYNTNVIVKEKTWKHGLAP